MIFIFTYSNCQGQEAILNGSTFTGIAALDDSEIPTVLIIVATGDVAGTFVSFIQLLDSYSGGIPVPVIGPPSGPPTGLEANETFLAIMLTWSNPSFNVQYIEIWRSVDDDLSTATLIGTASINRYIDDVGANAAYYYWVRAVGTDDSFSEFNATAGTLGTTGINP